MSFTLLLTLDNNPVNNKILKPRDYEAECVKCVKYWRLNGGKYRDIEILIDSDVNEITPNILNKFLEYNIKIEKLTPNINLKSNYGFINVHLTGLEAHRKFPNKNFLHIDLDMYLQRELPDIFRSEVILGVYSREDEPNQRVKKFGDRLAETDFIYTPANSTFYQDYVDSYNRVKLILKNHVADYDIEEYVADYLLNKNKYSIFENYEIGEGFLCQASNPYFIHRHIYC